MSRHATWSDWVEAARLRTLPASAAPVIMGAGIAAGILEKFMWGYTLLALIVALALQVGVNYANDYSDGIRGTDDDDKRVGPQRLTGPGLAKPHTVKMVSFICFGIAGIAGLILVGLSGTWYFIIAGIIAVIAAWFYTGGSHPYGYIGGIAELLVFIFFGLFATLGTIWTQVRELPWQAWAAAAGIGIASCSLLMVNNIRDCAGDRKAGKMTLAARMGEKPARMVNMAYMVVAGILSAGYAGWWSLLVIVAGIFVAWPVLSGVRGRGLILALRNTGFFTLGYGLIIAIAAAW